MKAVRFQRPAPRGGARNERHAFAANPLLAVKLPAWRSKFLLFSLFVAFAALVASARASCNGRARRATRARSKSRRRAAR